MLTVNMLEANSNLSKLVEQVESGAEAEVVIARNGRPAAKLVRFSSVVTGMRIGVAKGRFKVPDNIDMDNERVAKLFEQFEKLKQKGGDDDSKDEIVNHICAELSIHAQIEEEIFYPVVRDSLDADDLLDEAEVEHAGAKDLIAQLESMQPSDPLYDAKVIVLGEYIKHHVKEEQDEMFPKVKKAKIELRALGDELMQRKQELMAGMGLDESNVEDQIDEAMPRRVRKTVSARK